MENQNDEKICAENRYIVTKELFKSWHKENDIVVGFKIFWIVLSVIFVAITILHIVLKHFQDAIFMGVISFYCLYRGLIRNSIIAQKRYEMLSELYKKDNWERRIIFYNDYFETVDENINKLRFEYKDIVHIYKKDDYIKIKINNGYIRLYKDSFVKSDIDECERLLNDKLNNK